MKLPINEETPQLPAEFIEKFIAYIIELFKEEIRLQNERNYARSEEVLLGAPIQREPRNQNMAPGDRVRPSGSGLGHRGGPSSSSSGSSWCPPPVCSGLWSPWADSCWSPYQGPSWSPHGFDFTLPTRDVMERNLKEADVPRPLSQCSFLSSSMSSLSSWHSSDEEDDEEDSCPITEPLPGVQRDSRWMVADLKRRGVKFLMPRTMKTIARTSVEIWIPPYQDVEDLNTL